jgi:hypothetical protein
MHYEPCQNHAKKEMRALSPSFSGLAASSWDRLSESIPLEPVGKRKGQVFTFRLPYPWQSSQQ